MKRKAVLTAVTAILIAAATLAPLSNTTSAQGQEKIYLPLVYRDYPQPPTVFGIGVNSADASGGLGKLTASDSDWTRLPGLDWDQVEPTEGARNWSAVAGLEQHLVNLAQNKINVSLIIRMAPRWAHRVAGQFCGPVRSDKYGAMANFVRDAVARYSAAPYNVKYWEFWNEPDAPYDAVTGQDNRSGFGCWGSASQPFYNGREYGSAFTVAYQAAKQANPGVVFLIGGLLLDCDPAFKQPCAPGNFFEGVLQTTGGGFDGVSFHAYDYVVEGKTGEYTLNNGWNSNSRTVGPALIAKSRFLKQKMSQAGISGKILLNTETGVVRFNAPDGPCSDAVCANTKTAYVPQSYAAAIAEGLSSNMWYWLYGWWGSGLVSSNGTETDAFKAYKFARQTLANASYLGAVTSADVGGTPNVAGYKFRESGKTVWVIWSRDTVQRAITLATEPDDIFDPLGASKSTTGVSINYTPIYIVWNP